ncbi:shikimate dehydrogenase [Mycoplasmatota bacterium]|nr:shikimate dehydrogenase [Mycoplasmatota bacterium]
MFYLIGKTLKHSLSEFIHQRLSSINYKCLELDSLDDFFLEKNFKGLNVTIPYKEEVIKYLDLIDEKANKIGAVNTIINNDGILTGFNTDYDGFKALLVKNEIKVKDKRVLILGTGGSSKTVREVCKDLEARSITFCSRSKKKNCLSYDEVVTFDFELVINTTPVGMSPNNDSDLLLDLNEFVSLETVIDLIYNPLSTKLLLSAKENIKVVNGLYMLVYQAYAAHKNFIEEEINIDIIDEIYLELLHNNVNIVLIGMPMSGKSTYGKLLSDKLNMDFVDIDKEIVKREKETIVDIFKDGESYFRDIESQVVLDIAKMHNLVISTGGGVIKRKSNIDALKQNGIIVFLDRDLDEILDSDNSNRPLITDKQSIINLYIERINLYYNYADLILKNHQLSKEELYEIINSKWA